MEEGGIHFSGSMGQLNHSSKCQQITQVSKNVHVCTFSNLFIKLNSTFLNLLI